MSKNISDFCSGVNHIGVPTLDYNKSVEFYLGLGFTKASTKVNPFFLTISNNLSIS